MGTILVAINPFQYLPIYGGDRMLEYHRPGNRQLPPHVFGVAAAAHKDMALTGVDQARAYMHGAQRAECRVQSAECRVQSAECKSGRLSRRVAQAGRSTGCPCARSSGD